MLPSYVVLDLETTGGSAAGDAITEVAAVRIDNGHVSERWSSLVNPGTSIPGYIQNLTGISNEMVADAPRFKHLADKLLGLLEGSVLVAHNASFDHGFLRGEFARLGHALRVPSLCTVRLSRRLFPQFKSHSLDAIMQRHGLHTLARHRAMGDVDMVLAWLAQARESLGEQALAEAAQALLQPPLGLPVRLETQVEDLPDSPGVYEFYGTDAAPLYIGSATQLRHKVSTHLQSTSKSARERGIVHNTQRIEWHATAGELGAVLLAKRRMQEKKPTYGVKPSAAAVVNVGALHPWPHTGKIGLREFDPETGRSELHVFDTWHHLATVQDESEFAELFGSDSRGSANHAANFDLDIYRLLVKRLLTAGSPGVMVIRL